MPSFRGRDLLRGHPRSTPIQPVVQNQTQSGNPRGIAFQGCERNHRPREPVATNRPPSLQSSYARKSVADVATLARAWPIKVARWNRQPRTRIHESPHVFADVATLARAWPRLQKRNPRADSQPRSSERAGRHHPRRTSRQMITSFPANHALSGGPPPPRSHTTANKTAPAECLLRLAPFVRARPLSYSIDPTLPA